MKTPLPMIAAQLLAFAVLPASPALAIVLTAAAKLPVPDLRDWFAGQALAGLFAGQSVSMPFTEGHEKGMAKAAVRAYAAADAMLAERTKPIRQCELCGRSMGEEKGDLHDACIAHEQHAGE